MRADAALLRAAIPVFAALGDEHRLALVQQLGQHGPASLTQLCEGRDITRQAISKHLKVLADAGLVHGARHGRESIYELRAARVASAQKALAAISREWDARLDRLRRFVED